MLQFMRGQYLVVFCSPYTAPRDPCVMDDREEMRRLIDMVEKSASSNSVEQAVDDLKLFANTASFLANKLDTRLKSGDAKRKKPQTKHRRAALHLSHRHQRFPEVKVLQNLRKL